MDQTRLPSRIPGNNTITKYLKRDVEYYRMKDEIITLKKRINYLEDLLGPISDFHCQQFDTRYENYKKTLSKKT